MAVAGQTVQLSAQAVDANGDTTDFTIASKPVGIRLTAPRVTCGVHPTASDVGARGQVVISVSDGTHTQALPQFTLTVVMPRKSNYGHYFATHYSDTPADAATLCEQQRSQRRRLAADLEPG